jgi:hypothetical protein
MEPEVRASERCFPLAAALAGNSAPRTATARGCACDQCLGRLGVGSSWTIATPSSASFSALQRSTRHCRA